MHPFCICKFGLPTPDRWNSFRFSVWDVKWPKKPDVKQPREAQGFPYGWAQETPSQWFRGFRAVFKALLIHHWSMYQQQVNQKLPCWSGGLDTTYEGYLSRIISSLKTRHSILSNIEDEYKNNHHLPIHPLFDNLEYRWVIFPCNSNNNNNNNNFLLSFLLSLHACLLSDLHTSIPLPPPFVWAHSTPIPATNWRFHRIPRACRKHGYIHGNISHRKGEQLKNHRLKSAKKRIPLLNLIFWEVRWRRKEFHPESFPICNYLINYEWSFFNLFYPCLPIFVSSLSCMIKSFIPPEI